MAKERNAADVIEIFSDLGLPVCDDWPAIQAKVNAQKARYLKDKNSPDPAVRHRADNWFKDVSDLEHKRADLLKIVQQFFNDQSGLALEGVIASGLTTLTPEVVEQLRQFARQQCKADEALVDRFVRAFLQDRGVSVGGGALVRVGTIPSFTAAGGHGHISLSWVLPPVDCDTVEIARLDGNTGRVVEVYSGGGTSWVDHDNLTPGTRYTYRINAVHRNAKGVPTAAAAVCLGEVRQPTASCSDGRIELRWQPAGDGANVVVFRSQGRPPGVNTSGTPRATDPDTQRIYAGGGTAIADTNVVEGETYHYVLIADFGNGQYGRGVQVQATVPRPLPPVPSVNAYHTRDGAKDVIVVDWKPAPGAQARYTLVRRGGSTPPARPDDGTVLLREADQTFFRDEVKDGSGKRFTYAVFTAQGGRHSQAGTASRPVAVLSDVTDLAVTASDGAVELRWQTPAGTSSVIVRRSLNPPRNHTDGTLVRRVGTDTARDSDLDNGRRYHYLVCCGYRPDGGEEVFSSGVRSTATPQRFPVAVVGPRAEARGKEIVFTWNPPEWGEVVLLRRADGKVPPAGTRLRSADIDRLGKRVLVHSASSTVDGQPSLAEPYYVFVTVAGEHAAVGPTVEAKTYPDATALKAILQREGVQLRWNWPDGCNVVRVVRRIGDWPEGPDDPRATRFTCTREEYRNSGDRFIDRLQQGREDLCYVVYAQSISPTGPFFASGTDPGSRVQVHWEPWVTLRYELTSRNEKGQGPSLLWEVSLDTPSPNFGGLVLVANRERVPVDARDGVELARWFPARKEAVVVDLAPVQRRSWTRFHCKAMTINPAQSQTTLVIHPDVTGFVTADGEVEVPSALPPRTWNHSPRSVICPSCLERFGTDEILYTSYSGGTPMKARRTFLDWIFRRPPRPPVDSQGKRLLRKICAHCSRPLPFTAGTQESLLLGLVGAVYSGKTHYIASLIQRLQGPVGSDLRASLIAAAEETPEIYQRDFYEHLYGRHEQIPKTAGEPPPLIYDLTVGDPAAKKGELRGVTLALYDTAGENFDSREKVQEMVRYLSVASGVILLVDPLQLRGVREVLQTSVNLPPAEDPRAIIDRVLTELEEGKVIETSARLNVPAAVVLTKADLLRDAGLIEPNRLWCTEARHIDLFDRQAHDDMSGMLGECVQRWHPALYNAVATRFSRFAFFAVSATGCAPDRLGRFPFVSPFRVEDPLLWLLAELGVIGSHA